MLKFRGSDLEFSEPDIVVQIVQLTLINDSAILQKLKEASIVPNNEEDVFVVNKNVIKAKDEYKVRCDIIHHHHCSVFSHKLDGGSVEVHHLVNSVYISFFILILPSRE